MKHPTNNLISNFMKKGYENISDLQFFNNMELLFQVIEEIKMIDEIEFSIDGMGWIYNKTYPVHFYSNSNNFRLGLWEAVMECIREINRKEENIFTV